MKPAPTGVGSEARSSSSPPAAGRRARACRRRARPARRRRSRARRRRCSGSSPSSCRMPASAMNSASGGSRLRAPSSVTSRPRRRRRRSASAAASPRRSRTARSRACSGRRARRSRRRPMRPWRRASSRTAPTCEQQQPPSTSGRAGSSRADRGDLLGERRLGDRPPPPATAGRARPPRPSPRRRRPTRAGRARARRRTRARTSGTGTPGPIATAVSVRQSGQRARSALTRGTSSSSISGSSNEIGELAVGCASPAPSRRARLIQTLRRPSSFAGSMSWKSEAATCTWPRAARACAGRTPPSGDGAGLYEPISWATTTSSNGTPICTCDAAMKSSSVFERIASFQPRRRASSSAAPHLGERAPAGQRIGEAVLRVGSDAPSRAHRLRQHLAVGSLAVSPAAPARPRGSARAARRRVLAEHARELGAHAAVPVDQRAVAVKARPPLHA